MGIEINLTIEEYRKYTKKHLDKKRYIHSQGVSLTAAALAMRYNEDIDKARIAGILHDCAKGIPHKELVEACVKANILISSIERSNPELLHSKYGSYIAEKELKIVDQSILDAIAWHTTGKPDMSLLEKIIFVADYIEPNRTKLPDINEIRQLAFINIDKSIVAICKSTIKHLNSKNTVIDEKTISTYEYYKNII